VSYTLSIFAVDLNTLVQTAAHSLRTASDPATNERMIRADELVRLIGIVEESATLYATPGHASNSHDWFWFDFLAQTIDTNFRDANMIRCSERLTQRSIAGLVPMELPTYGYLTNE
jgi:hypothetical protein